MRLPEIRHNLRLITETCKGDLDGLAKEARTLQERRKWVQQEDERIRKKVEDEAERMFLDSSVISCYRLPVPVISRLQQVHLVVDDINTQAKEASTSYEATLEPFSAHFEKLIGLYPAEFERYRLDEIVVAAIAPIVCAFSYGASYLHTDTSYGYRCADCWRNGSLSKSRQRLCRLSECGGAR